MELIEKLQKIIEREIDNVPMVLTDPLTLRRLRAERLAQAALTALIEHAGQDEVTEGDRELAYFMAGRSAREADFKQAARHRQAAIKERDAEIERLREKLTSLEDTATKAVSDLGTKLGRKEAELDAALADLAGATREVEGLRAALYQYRSDLLYPPAQDSRERRIAMIDALLAGETNRG